MTMKKDRRARRTDKLIFEAIVELAKTKNVSDLSVSEICEKADISRQAFYARFSVPSNIIECYYNEFCEVFANPNKECKNLADAIAFMSTLSKEERMKIHLIFSLTPKDSSMLGIRVRFFEAMRNVVEAERKNKEISAFSEEAFIWSIYGAFCSFGNDEIDYDTLLDYLPKCYKLLTIQF